MTFDLYRDAHGIPHLRAGDVLALARAQGRVTARDRAWQLEVERHRVRGTTAAFLGREALPWDRFARRARLEDTARRCHAALEERDPETAAWVRAYVEGVNEGLAAGARRAPEFARTGLAPGRWEPWTPFGVWLGTHILFAGFPAKLWREEVVRHLGPEAVGLFAADGPGTAGSNGWLVTGARTATGQAVIAGDPHRFIEEPGVYQQIRLACPEFDVLGLAVPGVPGIAHFAHTGTVAWAITNAMADYQDLYRERLRRTPDGVEALDPDGTWRPAPAHTESIEVAGAEGRPEEVEVIETARGPVVIGSPPPHGTTPAAGPEADPCAPLALRHPPRVTGDLGFGALLPLLRARRVADVDRAFDRWAEPVNVVLAADTEGGTLHRIAGRVPVRAAANRVRPVPAWEPGHEWTGWHETPYGDLDDGLAVMANQRGPAAPSAPSSPRRTGPTASARSSAGARGGGPPTCRRSTPTPTSPPPRPSSTTWPRSTASPPRPPPSASGSCAGTGGWRRTAPTRRATRRCVARSSGASRPSPPSPCSPTRPRTRRSSSPGSPSSRASASPSNTSSPHPTCTASTAPHWSARPWRRRRRRSARA